jgi:ATP adenylyltransferase
MLERLWSGWRSAYVQSVGELEGLTGSDRVAGSPAADGAPSPDEHSSVFSRILESGLPDRETHIVHRGDTCFVIVNIHPYTSGHLLVVPYRVVSDLQDLSAAETTDLWATVTDAVTAVRHAYEPDGLNVGLNLGRPAGGSIPNHLHVHVVPRWTGDSNFMTAIANTQTLPEALVDTAHRVRAAWPSRS